MILKESGEDYLEAVLELEKKNGIVRSVDVAMLLGVTKPSVSRAMGNLKEAGYINMETYGNISLTQKGREHALKVLDKHKILAAFFEQVLGVEASISEKDACRAEHVLSNETMEKLHEFMEKYNKNASVGK